MHSSVLITRLIGPGLSLIGIGVLANGNVYRQVFGQFVHGYPFIYVSGVLLLLAGLAILNTHHNWTADWRSVITAIGWVLTGVGMFRILAPQFPAFVAGSLIAHSGFFPGVSIMLLALGGFIGSKGYVA
jgi:uncharacterized membrane protein